MERQLLRDGDVTRPRQGFDEHLATLEGVAAEPVLKAVVEERTTLNGAWGSRLFRWGFRWVFRGSTLVFDRCWVVLGGFCMILGVGTTLFGGFRWVWRLLDLVSGSLQLSNGVWMPRLGLGTTMLNGPAGEVPLSRGKSIDFWRLLEGFGRFSMDFPWFFFHIFP